MPKLNKRELKFSNLKFFGLTRVGKSIFFWPSISRKFDVLVMNSLLFDKLFLKIFPFSRKLSNLSTESPFYRKPILPRKNSNVFWMNFAQNPHFIEFPFYRECTVLPVYANNYCPEGAIV